MLKQTVSTPVYVDNGFTNQSVKRYRSYIETAVRGFVKACLAENKSDRYGLELGIFKSYKDLISFVNGFEPAREVKLSVSGISMLKNRKTISRAVPRTVETEGFIDYVLHYFEMFESDRFFRELSNEAVKLRKKSNDKDNDKDSVNASLTKVSLA